MNSLYLKNYCFDNIKILKKYYGLYGLFFPIYVKIIRNNQNFFESNIYYGEDW